MLARSVYAPSNKISVTLITIPAILICDSLRRAVEPLAVTEGCLLDDMSWRSVLQPSPSNDLVLQGRNVLIVLSARDSGMFQVAVQAK